MTSSLNRIGKSLGRVLLGSSLLLTSALLLNACQKPNQLKQSKHTQSMRVPPQVIAGWKAVLGSENIQLIQHGWQLRIIMPVDNLFKVGTTELTAPAADILTQIAYYLRTYTANTDEPFPIKIVGHTDITYSRAGGIKQSTQYAQIVGSFFWHHGVPSHRMKVEGVGSSQAIADSSIKGMATNRRVTILVH